MKAIIVNETSEYLACKVIHQELQKYLEDGWKAGNAVCLEEQKYNVYDFERNGEQIKVRFDLSSMRNRLGLQFNIMSMMLVNPNCDFEKLKEISMQMGDHSAINDQTFYKRYLAPVIERILVAAFLFFVIWFFVKCSD